MNRPSLEELNRLRDECHKIACEHGFERKQYSEQHAMCLVISELMEAVEADRKDRHADLEGFNRAVEVACDVCHKPINVVFEGYVKDTVEDELADAAIRILSYCGKEDLPLVNISERLNEAYFQERGNSSVFAEYRQMSFTEAMYSIVEDICYSTPQTALYHLFLRAHWMGFDLMEHIKLKMEYNRTREYMHSKRY